jgi:hypothetical protein
LIQLYIYMGGKACYTLQMHQKRTLEQEKETPATYQIIIRKTCK